MSLVPRLLQTLNSLTACQRPPFAFCSVLRPSPRARRRTRQGWVRPRAPEAENPRQHLELQRLLTSDKFRHSSRVRSSAIGGSLLLTSETAYSMRLEASDRS